MNVTLDSQQLRVFAAVARALNMRVAAEQLGITVSGVSHCLKALERDLDCRLFDRTSRRLALSPEGVDFLLEAEQILEHMRSARGRVRSASSWQTGSLRIAAEPPACRHLLPAVLREFRESFPHCQVALRSTSSHEAAAALSDESIDLALTVEPDPTARLRFTPVAEDDLLFCTHPLHPWAVRRQVDRADLARRKLIIPERATPTFQLIQSYFREENVTLESGIEVTDECTALELARLDLGVALVPRWLAGPDLESGRLISFAVGRRRLTRRWGILRAASHPVSFPEDLFANLCRSAFRSLLQQHDRAARDGDREAIPLPQE